MVTHRRSLMPSDASALCQAEIVPPVCLLPSFIPGFHQSRFIGSHPGEANGLEESDGEGLSSVDNPPEHPRQVVRTLATTSPYLRTKSKYVVGEHLFDHPLTFG